MTKKVIKLSSQGDLKIFMSPQRQKLLRHMSIIGEAVTPKAISDMLKISPSSAQFHIKKLETLGVVELDHKESINGIQAKFYKPADVDIHIGSPLEENLSKERYAIMQNIIKNTFDGLLSLFDTGVSKEVVAKNSEFVNGVVHMSQKEGQELLSIIREFVIKHEKKDTDTQPWEYTLLLYNTAIRNEENEKEKEVAK